MAKKTLAEAIREQQQWINDHGGDITGYIDRYGLPGEDRCYGDGGIAIYAADKAALDRLVEAQRRGGKVITRRALGLS